MSGRASLGAARAISAWELYTTGDYEAILNKFNGDSLETREIVQLAGLELGRPLEVDGAEPGVFAVLLEGMSAYHRKNNKLAAGALGSWLLKKDYFSSLILRRFLRSAGRTNNYSLMYAVSRKYINRPQYRELLAGPLLHAAYHLNKHEEAAEIFETYREFYVDREDLQIAAFSLMHLGRHAEAERFLLALYKKMRGTDYELDYEKVRESYQPLISRIPELEKKVKTLNRDQIMELGMAYLFSSQYKKAVRIFEGLRRLQTER